MIKAVIFDLDDTLISEYCYVLSGYRKVSDVIAKKYFLEKEEVFEKLISLFRIDKKEVFNRLLEIMNIDYDKEDILGLVKVYREHIPDIVFFDDVIPVVKSLKNMGVKTGIISDGYQITQRNKLLSLDAKKYFDYIILTDEWGKEFWKPSPKAFEEMKKMCNCRYSEMIYVGDNPTKDFYISKIIPINTIRIIRANGIYQFENYLEEIREKWRINSLHELLKLM